MKRKQRKPLVGAGGMTELLYSGKRSAVATWYGAVTGQQYKAGGNRRNLLVDDRDVAGALANWTDKQDGVDMTVFSIAPKAPPAKAAEPVVIIEEHNTGAANGLGEMLASAIVSNADDAWASVRKVVEATQGALDLAEQSGIDLSDVESSGTKVTKKDVQRHLDGVGYSGASDL